MHNVKYLALRIGVPVLLFFVDVFQGRNSSAQCHLGFLADCLVGDVDGYIRVKYLCESVFLGGFRLCLQFVDALFEHQ